MSPNIEEMVSVFEFQVDSIVTSLMQSWTDRAGEGLVITADTSMGKTLAFSIPVLVDAF